MSADAVLLTTAYVDPEHAGGGIGRMLVQAMARDLVQRGGIRAVEAFGDTRSRGGCVVSAEFLAHVGFRTHRPHPTTPRMRMDLRSALTWKDEVEAALERLVGVVRPALHRAGAPPADARDPGRRVTSGVCVRPAWAGRQPANSSSSLSIAALGRAPTMLRTTSPPW